MKVKEVLLKYDHLAARLGVMPITISIMFREGIDSQYRREIKRPKGQRLRGRARKTKSREIIVPGLRLRKIQRRIARLISSDFMPHPIAHGYAKGRSIATNAKTHVGARLLLQVDVLNYFGSIKRKAVVENLGRQLKGFTSTEIEMIADLCCYDGSLPHGSPASPVLSNMICYPLDVQLDELAQSSGCEVGRYSDDICFSTAAASFEHELVERRGKGLPEEIVLGEALPSLLATHGFEINYQKLKVQTRGGRMQVTGVIVGENEVSVPRKFRDNIRAGLHRWEKYGLKACASRQHRECCTRAFVSALQGCIAHVENVEGKERQHFRRLSQSFWMLLDRDRAQLCPVVDGDRQVCEHSRRLEA